MVSFFYAARIPQAGRRVRQGGVSTTFLLSQYLNEAKSRCLYSIFAISFAFFISYLFSMELVFLFVKPFLAFEKSFIFIELTEAFYITVKVCCFATLYAVFPFALYQVWCFVVPSLYEVERRRWNAFWGFSFFLLMLSLLIAYLIILPKIAAVLLQFEIKRQALTIQLEARIGSYINWSLHIFFLAALFCQWPIFSLFISYFDVFVPQAKDGYRKSLLALSILLAALVSPPDLISQWVIAFSLFVWFEMVLWLGAVQKRWCNDRRVLSR
jgi:sec-independent protein translocase protein TatC